MFGKMKLVCQRIEIH